MIFVPFRGGGLVESLYTLSFIRGLSGRWMRVEKVEGGGWCLLLDRVLLAGLLPFEDGVFALDIGPGQAAAGQVPDDARQLADLGGGGVQEDRRVVGETSLHVI